jgi:hypothetical protein
LRAFAEGSSDPFKKDDQHADGLPVTRFLILEYLTYENGDHAIEVFLLIAVFKLPSSIGLIFQGFGKVVGEDLEPSGAISVT